MTPPFNHPPAPAGQAQAGAEPKALAVAKAAQAAAPADAVIILFGSRARGDYHGRSDIDLAALSPTAAEWGVGGASYAAVSAAARAAGEKEYGYAMPVDLLPLDYPRFRRCRRAVNHVAHHIARDGIPMTQVPFYALDPDAAGDGDDGYPDNWPDISERLRDALDSFRLMRHDYNDGAEKYMGRHAHETLEHTYKALISALGASYPRTHNLRDLERLLNLLSERHGVHIPPSLEWLEAFYGARRYDPPGSLPIAPAAFFAQVEQVKDAIIARVYEITGTSEADLRGNP